MPQTTPSTNRAATRSLLEGFSLEMTAKDTDELHRAAPSIPGGTRIHLTYLAGETEPERLDAAKAILELGFIPVPHVAARRVPSEESLQSYLNGLQRLGTEHLFVIGGDPAAPEGPYADALSIVESGVVEAAGIVAVGFAGYPEGHPDIEADALGAALDAKLHAAADRGLSASVVTQFGFDVEPIVTWIRALRLHGVSAPLRIGVPGPTSVRRLIGFARRFGIGANAMIVKKYGFSLANLVGTAGPERFVDDLAARLEAEGLSDGVGVHFYTFGGLTATADWARNAAR